MQLNNLMILEFAPIHYSELIDLFRQSYVFLLRMCHLFLVFYSQRRNQLIVKCHQGIEITIPTMANTNAYS